LLLYGALGVLLIPGAVSLFVLELGLIPKAVQMAFPGSQPMVRNP
jgi:hypothetical protein